ncbi:MAG: Crp/Fnr family transcriptional regulator [Bacteroidetes bacterium]|nr:MAG: Crp/Fnr family transcriptional regulator [Bacteroidota bacterium]
MHDFLISRIKDYIALDDNEIQLIESLFVKEEYGRNEVLLQEGDICRKLYFVNKGIVRFSQLTLGEERTFVFRAEGAFCNDLESFLRKIPSRNSITSIEPTTVFSITYDNLQVFYNRLRYGDRFGRIAIEQLFVMVVNHLTTFYSESPEQRYIRFFSHHKEFLQRIPQYYIASYIGVTPQALCRIKKKMLQEN